MSASTAGAGLSTAPAIEIDKKVQPNVIQFPAPSGAEVDPQILYSESPSNSTTSKALDVATAVANFRPTHKEVISGIAPHVFDERRTRSRRRRSLNGSRRERSVGRRPSASFDFYHAGLVGVHGSAGIPTTHGGLSRRSSRSHDSFTPRPATSPTHGTANSMKWGASPLRISVSAVIAVDDVDKLLGQDQEQELSVKNESEANPDPVSVTLPTLTDHRRGNSRMSRLELRLGKHNDSDLSPPSSDDGDSRPWSRRSKWRIDIQVLKSIGLKIKSSRK